MQSQQGQFVSGGPAWANPLPPSLHVTQQTVSQEEEFFAPLSTLDEPVMETIMRDVLSVASKLKVVMLPLDSAVSVIL
jgi:hypothetical protein